MKRAVSRMAALVLFLCFLGPVRSVSAPAPPPKPETVPSLPAASASQPRAEPSSAAAPEEELPPPAPESRHEPEPYQGPPEGWTPTPAYEVEPFFPLDKESQDEAARRLGQFLRNIQWGTDIADINYSRKAEFFSAEELDPILLLECCLMNEERTKEVPGARKEDVERRARFYFGEDAVIDHAAAGEDEHFRITWWFDEGKGIYLPTGWDRYGYSEPFLLSYVQDGDRYEVVFTSVTGNVFYGVTSPDPRQREWGLTMEEAESWYREHGARARAVLREQGDGRLTMESLEILRGYDPWEGAPAE